MCGITITFLTFRQPEPELVDCIANCFTEVPEIVLRVAGIQRYVVRFEDIQTIGVNLLQLEVDLSVTPGERNE